MSRPTTIMSNPTTEESRVEIILNAFKNKDLGDNEKVLTPKQISEKTGLNVKNVQMALMQMIANGQIVKVAYGKDQLRDGFYRYYSGNGDNFISEPEPTTLTTILEQLLLVVRQQQDHEKRLRENEQKINYLMERSGK